MTGEVVPFGKYRGKRIEELAADPGYCEWLVAQPWFAEKYRNVYNVVINYGGEPQDSPEHNEMQARFLEEALCLGLADVLDPQRLYDRDAAAGHALADPYWMKYRACFDVQELPVGIVGRTFEDHGWDVTYDVLPATIKADVLPGTLPPCTCRCDHNDCLQDASCHGGSRWCKHSSCGKKKRTVEAYDHCTPSCHWATGGDLSFEERAWLKLPERWYQGDGMRVLVEVKPDLGDDYPSVLRQVKRYSTTGAHCVCCVVVRRHGFEHVTFDLVRKIFAASDIQLIDEESITEYAKAHRD